MTTITCSACKTMTADEIATAGWQCGSCGLNFAHDEGIHDVQFGIYHEFTCKSCYDEADDADINMDRIVEGLRQEGVRAYVEQTGGGCATIYIGETIPDSKGAGWDGYELCAGPGWFDGPGWTLARGARSDFYIGPDDQGETDPFSVTEDMTDGEILAYILAAYRALHADATDGE